MARPRTRVGTCGTIKVVQLRDRAKDQPAVWEARTRFRTATGRMVRPRRRGHTRKVAEDNLKEHLTRLTDEATGRSIDPGTRMSRIAELWLEEIDRQVRQGMTAHGTYDQYRGRVKNWLRPKLGELSAREVTVMDCDRVIQAAREHSYETAKSVRVVLRGVCGYAVRHGAMTSNPVDSTSRLAQGTQAKDVLVLDTTQRKDLLTKLAEHADTKRVDSKGRQLGPRADTWDQLPEIMEALLATGARIGEILALTAEGIDATDGQVTLDHHVVRVTGEGLRRVPGRKGGRPGVTLQVPSWSRAMFRRRRLASGGGPVFAAWDGGWLDPRNVHRRLRAACDATGYGWVTSHVARRTVGTHLGDSDVATTAIADQLGNTVDVVEQSYRRKRVDNASIADQLETLMDDEEDTG